MTFANTTIICLLGHGDDVVDDDVPRIAHHSSYVDPNANLCKGIGTTGYCGPSENECIARGTFDIQNTQSLCVSVTPDLHVGSGKSSNIKNTVGHPQYRPHYRTQKKSSSTHMFFFVLRLNASIILHMGVLHITFLFFRVVPLNRRLLPPSGCASHIFMCTIPQKYREILLAS